MKDRRHLLILDQIKKRAGKPTKHTFLNNYLGNDHPRYAINNPEMRSIAREFMRTNQDMRPSDLAQVITSLVQGESGTEKMMAGFLLDYSKLPQRKFHPSLFDTWLDELVGWVEIDTLCTGKYSRTEIPAQWRTWRALLAKFSRSKNIGKRRASLVLLCAPMRYTQEADMARLAFGNIARLFNEKEVLITKAISWLLRSMIALYRKEVIDFVNANTEALPAIAVRETRIKLKTGIKGKRKL